MRSELALICFPSKRGNGSATSRYVLLYRRFRIEFTCRPIFGAQCSAGLGAASLNTNSGDRAKKASSQAWNRDRSQSSPFDVKARTIFRIAVKAAGKPRLLRYSF